ncbi:hypothetical protein [Pedobacter steynii]
MNETVFNIKIGYGQNEVTLTILPQDDYFKVIYFGGIMGAVGYADADWTLIDPEKIAPGDLPMYTPDLKGERLKVILNEATVDAIGKEIEMHYHREE